MASPDPADSSTRLTKQILQTAVSNHLKVDLASVEVESYDVSAGSKLGDNFATDVKAVLVRATVDGKPRELNYIVKLAPTDSLRQQVMGGSFMFECECKFYEETASDMQKVREEANLPEIRLARSYYASAERGVLVLENLKLSGYQIPEKSCKGLGSDPFEQVLISLAEFHATTYHLLQTYDGGHQKLLKDKPWFGHKSLYEISDNEAANRMMHGLHSISFHLMVAVLKEAAADRQDLSEKLLAQLGVWNEKAKAACRPDAGAFRTIIHGDIWYNNTLLKFGEDGSFEDVVMIDFQLMNVSNPAVDLVYLFGSSTFPSKRRLHKDCWLRVYHLALERNLLAFGYPEATYAFKQLKSDYEQASYQAFAVSILHSVPLLARPGSESGKLFDFTSEENKKAGFEGFEERLKQSSAVIAREAKEIPFFMERIVDAVELAVEDGLI